MKRTKELWRSMWKRCGGISGQGKGSVKYKGIIFVCERWQEFSNFIEDMGLAPDGLSLDRIENSKGYSKENCRWASCKTQTRNRSITRKVEYQGEQWFLKDLADHLGIRYDTMWCRLQAGWDVSRLGDKPNRGVGAISRRTRIINYKNKEYYVKDLASLLDVTPEVLWGRYRRGWSEDQFGLKTDN